MRFGRATMSNRGQTGRRQRPGRAAEAVGRRAGQYRGSRRCTGGAARGARRRAAGDPSRVFFTLNGRFLGYAFDGSEEELYPTVGVDTECPVCVNFGERPFVFDLREFARKDDEGGDGECEGWA